MPIPVSHETSRAIGLFKHLDRHERERERIELQLKLALEQVPKEEFPEYVRVTEEFRQRMSAQEGRSLFG